MAKKKKKTKKSRSKSHESKKRSRSAKKAYHKTGLYKLNKKRAAAAKKKAKKSRGHGKAHKRKVKHRFVSGSPFAPKFHKKRYGAKAERRLARLLAHRAKKRAGVNTPYLETLRKRLEIQKAFEAAEAKRKADHDFYI